MRRLKLPLSLPCRECHEVMALGPRRALSAVINAHWPQWEAE
jgi:hypothetical protein